MRLNEIKDQTEVNRAYFNKWIRPDDGGKPWTFDRMAKTFDMSGPIIDVSSYPALWISVLQSCNEKAPFKFRMAGNYYYVSWKSLKITGDYPLGAKLLDIKDFSGDLLEISNAVQDSHIQIVAVKCKKGIPKNVVQYVHNLKQKLIGVWVTNDDLIIDGRGKNIHVTILKEQPYKEYEVNDAFELQDILIDNGFEAYV